MNEHQKVEKRYDAQQVINYLDMLGNPVVEVRIFRKDRYLNGQYTGNIVAGYFDNQHLRNYHHRHPKLRNRYQHRSDLYNDPATRPRHAFPHREPSENGTRYQRPYIRQPRDGFLSVSYRCRPTQDQGNIIDK